MSITVRPADGADTEKCDDILYRAFQTIAENHNFPATSPPSNPLPACWRC